MKANACPRHPTSSSSSSREGSRRDTSRALGMFFFVFFLFYSTNVYTHVSSPAPMGHCQSIRTSFWTYQGTCFSPQPRVSTHQHPFWTHWDLFSPTNTHFHPPALVSSYGHPLSTHQNFVFDPAAPLPAFSTRHGPFWTTKTHSLRMMHPHQCTKTQGRRIGANPSLGMFLFLF